MTDLLRVLNGRGIQRSIECSRKGRGECENKACVVQAVRDGRVDGSVKMLEERVKEKDGEAMWMLGLCKEYGRGIEQDIEGAVKLYQESKEAGNEIGEILVIQGGQGRGSGEMGIRSL